MTSLWQSTRAMSTRGGTRTVYKRIVRQRVHSCLSGSARRAALRVQGASSPTGTEAASSMGWALRIGASEPCSVSEPGGPSGSPP